MYVSVDGSEVCLSLNEARVFCARDGAVSEKKLELKFSRYETYEEKTRDVPPQGPAGVHQNGQGIRETTLSQIFRQNLNNSQLEETPFYSSGSASSQVGE